MMQACTVVSSQTVLMASGSPLSPSQTAMHTSATPRFFSSASTLQPKLGSLAAVAEPQAQDVALTVDGDPDHHIDRFVADLTVADLHHDFETVSRDTEAP
jgi:hypothetical protein